jgi:ferritin-like metal-binding protein YciE
MKKLTTLNEVLTFHLEGMYDAEKKTTCDNGLHRRSKIEYTQSGNQKIWRAGRGKRTKLKRIFSYLLVQPFKRKNNVIDSLLKDTHDLLNYAATDHLREAVLLACIQSINHYKIAGYNTALAFAIDLNLDTVADLLHEILVWEKETNNTLTKIAFEELNKKESSSLPS